MAEQRSNTEALPSFRLDGRTAIVTGVGPGLARYRWDGESGAGMLERSVRVEGLRPVSDDG